MRINRILLVFGLAAVGAMGLAEAQPEFIGHDQCKVCHNKKPEGEQWSVWKEMNHAKALDALMTDKAKKVAEEKGLTKPPHEAPECLKCHVTAYDVEKMAPPAKIKMDGGVQCETCHGPGSDHVTDGRDVMFKKKTADEIDWMANLKKIEEALCRECHNEESPTWDTEKYTLEDGSKAGFDFEQAKEKIAHPNPTKAKTE